MYENKPCIGCEGRTPSYYPAPQLEPCSQVPKTCQHVDASCVIYWGPKLFCSNIDSGKDVEYIIQKFDEKLCSAEGGDWSTFDYNCLSDTVNITTAQEFVYYMTLEHCNLKTSYNTFVGTTYQTQVESLQNQINSILAPQLNLCQASGIIASDTYTSIITKLANKVCEFSAINVSTANWSQCFTVPTLPTTVVQGFNVVLDQICQVKSSQGITALPTFNNQGSCLSNPGTNDTLVSTIGKIKDRLCQGVVYDINLTQWGCIAKPSDFQGVINSIVNTVQTLISKDVLFDANVFKVVNNGCQGRTVTLQDGITGTDRLVASDSSDNSPGTLSDKLYAGDNILISNTDIPGKVVIKATSQNDKVSVNAVDTNPGFLFSKVLGSGTPGVSLNISESSNNSQAVFTPSLDFSIINNQWFDAVESDPILYARFCALICGCKPCKESGIPDPPRVKRFRIRVVNNSPKDTFTNRYTTYQNNPVLGWVDNIIAVQPNQTYESGWYDVTSTSSVLSSYLKVVDTGTSGIPQNLNIRVLQPGNSQIPGAGAFQGVLGAGYTNSNFSLGNLTTDITLEIRIS